MPSIYKSKANPNAKKRIAGYKEKSGETHETKKGFYKSKAKKAMEKAAKTKWRTADGKIHDTRAGYEAWKKKIS
jgi:hypothetical protein